MYVTKRGLRGLGDGEVLSFPYVVTSPADDSTSMAPVAFKDMSASQQAAWLAGQTAGEGGDIWQQAQAWFSQNSGIVYSAAAGLFILTLFRGGKR